MDRSVKFLVVSFTEIVKKFACPGTAIAPIGIKPRIKAKRRTGNDWNQVFTGLQLLQFSVILNAGQVHAVDLVILQ